jgi:carbonic anhydrase
LSRSSSLLPLLLLCFGCNKLFAKDQPAPAADEKAEASEPAHGEAAAPSERGEPGSGRYSVPFAWEISPEEPLAKARRFMSDVLNANDAFVGQGRDHFKPFLEAEHPRATVLTCSDSRIQPSAWDANPENDSYTVRNLGNQLSTALGSVEYGVERLHTPVLLIIGHTGCEAVQQALDASEKDKGPIADELSHIKLREGHAKKAEMDLLEAVTANVNAQVAEAVTHFASFVQSGELTVVGAVYDHKNEMEHGHGRLLLVNVNSNVEQARIDAFQEAVKEKKVAAPAPAATRRAPTPDDRMRTLFEGAGALPQGRASISAVNIIGNGGFDAVEVGTVRESPGHAASPARGAPAAHTSAPARSAEQNKADIAASLQRVAAAVGAPGPSTAKAQEPATARAAAAHGAPAAGHGSAENGHAAAADPKPRPTSPAAGEGGHDSPPPVSGPPRSEPGPPPGAAREAPAHDSKPSAPAKSQAPAREAKPGAPAKAPEAGHEKPPAPAKSGAAGAPDAAHDTAPSKPAEKPGGAKAGAAKPGDEAAKPAPARAPRETQAKPAGEH